MYGTKMTTAKKENEKSSQTKKNNHYKGQIIKKSLSARVLVFKRRADRSVPLTVSLEIEVKHTQAK